MCLEMLMDGWNRLPARAGPAAQRPRCNSLRSRLSNTGISVVLAAVAGFSAESKAQNLTETQNNYRSYGPVTIRLSDGSVFEQAKVLVDREYLSLTIQPLPSTGATVPTRNASFEQVESIVDAHGTDITQKAFGHYVRPGFGATVMPRGRPWQAAFTVGPTVAIPAGEWFSGINANVGVRASLAVAVSDELAVDVAFQYQKFGLSNSLRSSIPSGVEPGLNIEKIVLGIRYTERAAGGRLWYYGTFGAGTYRHRATATIRDGNTSIQATATDARFGMSLSGGLTAMVAPRVGWDLGCRFDQVFGHGNTGYLIEFESGLLLAF